MNVMLTLSTPEIPEPHEVIHRGVDSVLYSKGAPETYSGIILRMTGLIHRYDLRIVLDMVVTQ